MGPRRERRPAIPGDAQVLDGVRVANAAALALFAGSLARRGRVAYRVAAAVPEHRASGRNRMRLRSAKMLSAEGRFLGECRVHDRSSGGARLALAGPAVLPRRFCLYEDESGEASWVSVVWRRGAAVGLRFCAPGAPPPLRPSDRFALRQRYYAVADR